MGHINCADCLKTYRPYSYVIALLRVLMYGFSDWWEFEDERVIEEKFREYWRNQNVQWWLMDMARTYRREGPFVEHFNFYYKYLENKRCKSIPATFICVDCEKYYCTNCADKHSGHFTFSKDDRNETFKWRRISVEILDRVKAEGDRKLENMKREQRFLCDVVDVRCEHDEQNLHYVLNKLEQYEGGDHVFMSLLTPAFRNNPGVEVLHIFNDQKRWAVTDDANRYIKIFNANDNKMTRRIKLSSPPYGITEIPSTDPSQCLIAVSYRWEKQIHIMNIHRTPAQVISHINVQGECYDVAYCNNKLITRCLDNLDGAFRHSIHVMDMSGGIINIIDLNQPPSSNLKYFVTGCMSVHSGSETIYVCHWSGPSYVIGLSLNGHVLHSVIFTDLEPRSIHVDKDQNVYVMDHWLPIYKLSADFRHRETFITDDVVDTYSIRALRVHHDKLYLVSSEGHVYILQHE